MKAVYQRVREASVAVDGETIAAIGQGVLLLVGVTVDDTAEDARILAAKVAGFRVFSDQDDKFNFSVTDVGGEVLAVSQFTLCANTKHGRRPDFLNAARPETAEPLFERFVGELRALGVPTQTGRFGADMKVSLLNDGPVTLMLDTTEWRK